MMIAEAARCVLDVGFEVKNRIAVTRVAFACELDELRGQKIARAAFRIAEDARVEALVKGGISREQAAVEQGKVKLDVVFLDAPAFLDRAARGADPEPQVPERARKLSDQRLELFFGGLVLEEEQDVEIGVREQHPAAVAAERQQTEAAE